MRIASIDIGSNTVLLLIADYTNGKLKTVINKYNSPRLGKDLVKGQLISPKRIAALYEILSDYLETAKYYRCDKIIAVATNAFRIASNGETIKKNIIDKFNIEMNVISGDEEAELSFLGSTYELSDKYTNVIVIDIGGGSSEFTQGNKETIKYRQSFSVGAVSLTEEFIKSDPPSIIELELLTQKVEISFCELGLLAGKDMIAVAVAGTPTTLSCIAQNLYVYDETKVEMSILSIQIVSQLIDKLSKMKSEEIATAYPNLTKGREDIILSGAIILKSAMNVLNLNNIFVSGRGLRYGAALKHFYENI